MLALGRVFGGLQAPSFSGNRLVNVLILVQHLSSAINLLLGGVERSVGRWMFEGSQEGMVISGERRAGERSMC